MFCHQLPWKSPVRRGVLSKQHSYSWDTLISPDILIWKSWFGESTVWKVSMGPWGILFVVLLGTNIPYCKVLFFVSTVHLRCGLPSFEQVDALIRVGLKRLEHWVGAVAFLVVVGRPPIGLYINVGAHSIRPHLYCRIRPPQVKDGWLV